MSKMENQLNLCINNRFCINKMSFVRKNTPIEDVSFSDMMKKAKKGMKKAKKGMKKAKELKNKFDDELKTLSDDAGTSGTRHVQLMENGKQFVPPNKL